jgi:hypothetical protein
MGTSHGTGRGRVSRTGRIIRPRLQSPVSGRPPSAPPQSGLPPPLALPPAAAALAAHLPGSGGSDGGAEAPPGRLSGGSSGAASRYVGVQHITASKVASKTWIPRPTVRMLSRDGRRAFSKQLTLAYCDRCVAG